MNDGNRIEIVFDKDERTGGVKIRLSQLVDDETAEDGRLWLYFPLPSELDPYNRGGEARVGWTKNKAHADYFEIGSIYVDAFAWLVSLHESSRKVFASILRRDRELYERVVGKDQ